MKQFIIHLNDKKIADKKFIIEDLDATHLLIRGEVRDEIARRVDEWMDEVCNSNRADYCNPAIQSYFVCMCKFYSYFNSIFVPIPMTECLLYNREDW